MIQNLFQKLGINPNFYKKPIFYVSAAFDIGCIFFLLVAINQPSVIVQYEELTNGFSVLEYDDTFTDYCLIYIEGNTTKLTGYQLLVEPNENKTFINMGKKFVGVYE